MCDMTSTDVLSYCDAGKRSCRVLTRLHQGAGRAVSSSAGLRGKCVSCSSGLLAAEFLMTVRPVFLLDVN